ncbi:protein kinase domain-containing protein [Cordyceps militaris CM01]|uniref:non-specific serine/threonine protein kinase n=1 Tax=Cordyceps militaris (strain CM01) TaxID=983644 RepID=G3JGT5_CORMM|nr:protein kinase domain-containing protein [Cordyceps militaris CM01]EGX92449.1 protein kinase domain-containing protein [Cordyceps militaris CM01]
MTDNTSRQPKAVHTPEIYIREMDLEEFEGYTIGGYHPIVIGDTFQKGRYKIAHKLGYGGYSTIWLARDNTLDRYVSLKVLIATESPQNTESNIIRKLQSVDTLHPGQQFIPHLLDEFSIDGPNGRHTCLVQEAARGSIAASKDDSINLMFPTETARSIAAQLIMGVAYLHSLGICHGDLHLRNILFRDPHISQLNPDLLSERFPLDKVPIHRVDGGAAEPHAPPYAVYPLHMKTAADKLEDPIIAISDYGTSFVLAAERSPELHTPPLFLPPEDFFQEPITLAADVWTLGVNLYEIMGERPLFETFSCDRDDIIADMISTLGQPPARWWDKWENRPEFFQPDGSWRRNLERIMTPVFRPLQQRMWDMGRGMTPETCEWDVEGGEMQALEDLIRSMLAFEPAKRPTAEQLIQSEYMVKWAMPAWERQLERTRNA